LVPLANDERPARRARPVGPSASGGPIAPSSAASLSEAEAQRYRMARVADVERMVAERRTHLLVYQNWDVPPPAPDWQGAIVRGGYRLIATVDTTKIYAR